MKEKENIVVLRAIDNVAKRFGLSICAIKVNDNCYDTGQTIVPGKPETVKFLTFAEAKGDKELTEERMQQFPYVIDPLKNFTFLDGDKFDLNIAKDKANINLIKLHPLVANSKSKIKRKSHHFYLENKEVESIQKNKDFNKILEAGLIIRSMGMAQMQAFIGFLKVFKTDYSLNSDLSTDLMITALNGYAEKDPDLIINYSKPEMVSYIKVCEFVIRKIITKKNNGYYEGGSYITSATDLTALVAVYNNDVVKASRWDKKLVELAGGNIYEGKEPELSRSQKAVDLLKESVTSMNFKKAYEAVIILEEIDDDISKNALKKYHDTILRIKEVNSAIYSKPEIAKDWTVIKFTPESLLSAIREEPRTIPYNVVEEQYKVVTGSEKGSTSWKGYETKLVEFISGNGSNSNGNQTI